MSIIKHPEQRVGVFIDTQNVYHSAKNIYHARANFGNILKDSVAGRRLVRARAYAVTGDYLAAEPYCVFQPPAWQERQNAVDGN